MHHHHAVHAARGLFARIFFFAIAACIPAFGLAQSVTGTLNAQSCNLGSGASTCGVNAQVVMSGNYYNCLWLTNPVALQGCNVGSWTKLVFITATPRTLELRRHTTSNPPNSEEGRSAGSLLDSEPLAAKPYNQAPTVTLTNPVNGGTTQGGAPIVLTVNASDADGSIARVEYYDSAQLLGSSTIAPFSLSWANAASGNHTIRATAFDNLGASANSAANSTFVNLPPSVGISAPANNTYVTVGSSVAISANAYDEENSMARVEFYAGASQIGSDSTSPYAITWSSVPAGSHTVTAKAFDIYGGITTSAAITIIGNAPPVPSLTSPTPSTTLLAGQPITLVATATDADGISFVDIIHNGASFGADYVAPYTATIANPAAGTHTIQVRARDLRGIEATSAPVTLTVSQHPPTVTLTAPANNAVFTSGQNVTITADPRDTDGTISQVEFYEGNTLLFRDLGAPFTHTWAANPAGQRALKAIAFDNAGASATSPIVNVTVNRPPTLSVTPPANSGLFHSGQNIVFAITSSDPDAGNTVTVQVLEGGTARGTVTGSAPSFNFSWSGAPIGAHTLTVVARDNHGATATTDVAVEMNGTPTVGISAPANGSYPIAGETVTVSANASDSDGSVSQVEFFIDGVSKTVDTQSPFSYAWTNMTAGAHTLSARATDNRGGVGNSSTVNVTGNVRPSATLVSLNGTSFRTGQTISLRATGSDSDGSVVQLQIFDGGTQIASASSASFDYTWSGAAIGTHNLTVRALDNRGAAFTTTTPLVVTVTTQPPTVGLSAPANGSVHVWGQPIVITATADDDSQVTQVQFYAGTTLLGTDGQAPYQYTWNAAASGTHSLTAVATDSDNQTTTSAARSVIVNKKPVISVDAPANGSTTAIAAGANTTLRATATDADGAIDRVQFYKDGAPLGAPVTSQTSTFTYEWTAVPAGTYAITARAYDAHHDVLAEGGQVKANQGPTVSFVGAITSGVVLYETTVTIAADATDSDGPPPVVEFFVDGTRLGSDTPTSIVDVASIDWSGFTPGPHTLEVRATDTNQATATATLAVFVNRKPTPVTLSVGAAPAGGYHIGHDIVLSASATDIDGQIKKLQFFEGNTLLETVVTDAATATASKTLKATAIGERTFTVVATDNHNATHTSAPVTVDVVQRPPYVRITKPADPYAEHSLVMEDLAQFEAEAWDYDDQHNEMGVAYVEFFIDGARTESGADSVQPWKGHWRPTKMGAVTITARATDLSGASSTSAPMMGWVHHRPKVNFHIPSEETYYEAGQAIRVVIAGDDDYFIDQMKISFGVEGPEYVVENPETPCDFDPAWRCIEATWPNAPIGLHTITARIEDNHGAVATSTMGVCVGVPCETIEVELTSPAPQPRVRGPGEILLAANVTTNAEVDYVQFYDGVTAIGGAQSRDHEAPWELRHTPAVGPHEFYARAITTNGKEAQSQIVYIDIVEGANVPPVVQSVTSPPDNFRPPEDTDVLFEGTAADTDGQVTRVEIRDHASGGLIREFTGTAASLAFNATLPRPTTDKTYRIVAIDDDGAESAPVLRTVRVSMTTDILAGLQPQASDDIPETELPAHQPQALPVSGKPSVSGGAASYELPIAVPPGRRGMEPSLSVAYSSRAGNGSMGMGWSLSGVSSIHRCPRTVAQDNYVRAVAFDDGDALCLDGQRLIPVAVTGNGTAEYRTEIETYQRISQFGAGNSTYFKVETKGGEILHYGPGSPGGDHPQDVNAIDAVVQPARESDKSRKTLAWLLAYRVDRLANSVSYFYTEPKDGTGISATPVYGESLLSRIAYTGVNGSGGTREVRFNYGNGEGANAGRPDRTRTYLSGYRQMQSRLLESVETFVGSEKIRSYKFSYHLATDTVAESDPPTTASGRSLLKQIDECAHVPGSDPVCRAPLTFEWSNKEAVFDLKVDPNLNQGSGLQEYLGDFRNSVKLLAFADVNGDGSRDVLWQGPSDMSAPNSLVTRVLTLTPDRTVKAKIDMTPLVGSVVGLDGGFSYLGRSDFDEDGRPEFLARYDDNGVSRLQLLFWKGPAGGTQADQVYTKRWNTNIALSDVKGFFHVADMDGLPGAEVVLQTLETCAGGGSRRKIVVMQPDHSVPEQPVLGGPADVDIRTKWFEQIAEAYADEECTTPAAGKIGPSVARTVDFNGDGLLDLWVSDDQLNGHDAVIFGVNAPSLGEELACVTAPGSGYRLSSPQPLEGCLAGTLSAVERNRSLTSFWLDANGDGLEDWLYVDNAADHDRQWALRLNLGGKLGGVTKFQRPQVAAYDGLNFGSQGTFGIDVWAPWRTDRMRPMDIDSDGRSELLIPTDFAARICVVQFEDQVCSKNLSFEDTKEQLASSPGRMAYPDKIALTKGDPEMCGRVHYCPQIMRLDHPRAGLLEVKHTTQAKASIKVRNRFGEPAVPSAQWPVKPLLGTGITDYSSYHMGALRFVDDGQAIALELVPAAKLGIVLGQSTLETTEDLYGDGLADVLTKVSCYVPGTAATEEENGCGVPISFNGETESGQPVVVDAEMRGVEYIEPGIPVMTPAVLVNENLGHGSATAFAAPDLLIAAVDPLGNRAEWDYSPLGASDGRSATDPALYSVSPSRDVGRNETLFTSSMSVVARLSITPASTAGRTYRYSYRDAMYNLAGRGFQGFRTIIEEDFGRSEAPPTDRDYLKTTTHFDQYFPLAGKPKEVVIEAVRDDGQSYLISRESLRWTCAGSAACPNDLRGPTPPQTPHLADKTTETYEAIPGSSKVVSKRVDVIADVSLGSFCTTGAVPINSGTGLDAHGNVEHQASFIADLDGQGNLAQSQCDRTATTYAEADTSNWWIDKVYEIDSFKSITHAIQPAGGAVGADEKHLTQTFAFNLDRTLSSKSTSSPSDAKLSTTESYTYTARGLPRSITLSYLEGTPAVSKSRMSESVYASGDSYFPASTRNALGQLTLVHFRDRDGQQDNIVDPNGIETAIEFDAFGMPVRTTAQKAGESLMHPAHVRINAEPARVAEHCPTESKWLTYKAQGGSPTTVTCHDSQGRVLRTSSSLFGGGTSKVDVSYDARGNVASQSEPYDGSAEVAKTTFGKYDALNRLLEKVQDRNVETYGDLKTTYTHAGRETTITLCGSAVSQTPAGACLVMKRMRDGMGRYIETTDAIGGKTRFWHDALGNVSTIEDAHGSLTRAVYNAFGQRTQVDDPNQGTWNFVYNSLGELESQTDARQLATTYHRDALGRVTTRLTGQHRALGDDVNLLRTRDAYVWDSAPGAAIGMLHSQTREYLLPSTLDPENTTSVYALERSETFGYDESGRLTNSVVTQGKDGQNTDYSLGWKYDTVNGRLLGRHWNNEEGLHYLYDSFGNVTSIRDASGSHDTYWAAVDMDARGAMTGFALGGGEVIVSRPNNPITGQMMSVDYRKGADIQHIAYTYDLFGNLQEQIHGTTTNETFTYDRLHRLASAMRQGSVKVEYCYDAVGNLTAKSDFSQFISCATPAYGYGIAASPSSNAGPNAVSSVALLDGSTARYAYDANGNLVDEGQDGIADFVFDAANLPVLTRRDGVSLTFAYGPDGSRTRQFGLKEVERRTYVDGYEETPVERKYPLGDFGQITRRGATERAVEYFATDRLGSVIGVYKPGSNGYVFDEGRGFDPFGKPRDRTWGDIMPAVLPDPATTPKGFTGHEHLNAVGLIHMNGRAFDYNLGRFLSVDPVIQFPLYSQSLNPYSYLLNNPFSGTDPTGFLCKTTDNANQCLEDGANAIFDEDGKQVGTIIVGHKGDTLTFASKNATISGVIGSRSDFLTSLAADKDLSAVGAIASRLSGSFEAQAATQAATFSPAPVSRPFGGRDRSAGVRYSVEAGDVANDVYLSAGDFLFGSTDEPPKSDAVESVWSIPSPAAKVGTAAGILLTTAKRLLTPSASNYAKLFRRARPDLPSDWQVHHSYPQRYEELMKSAGVNIHEVQFLRGVDPQVHATITTLWERFHKSQGSNPTAAQIADYAKKIDEEYGDFFMWPGY